MDHIGHSDKGVPAKVRPRRSMPKNDRLPETPQAALKFVSLGSKAEEIVG
jgi:hypothetical protein